MLMMLLVWAPYQMFVVHITQIMPFLCVKHWRIKLIVKLAVSGNEIMCGGHKKQGNLRQGIYVLSYAILRSLVSSENLKNTWRGELILAKLQAFSMLQPQPPPPNPCFKVNYKRTTARLCSKLKTERANWRCSGVTVNNYSLEKYLPSNHLLGKNFTLSTYLIANKYSFQEVRKPLTEFGVHYF